MRKEGVERGQFQFLTIYSQYPRSGPPDGCFNPEIDFNIFDLKGVKI